MRCLIVLAAALTACAAADQPPYDLVLRNGTIVDGAGRGKSELDVEKKVVAPGFIDVHTHAEEITDLPKAENFVRMGVTTLVLGNCGSSVTNVGALFERCRNTGASVNVATLVGHGTVRARAMGGHFDRAPTPAELEQMQQLVDRAMNDGALGLSTGLIYLPGTYSKTDEIIELARVAARHGGIYASHMRSESERIFAALDEVFQISHEAGIRSHVSHIKLSGKSNWNQPEKVIAAIEKARSSGLDITQDQYGYTASSTSISTLVPNKYREAGKFRSYYTNEVSREKMIAEMLEPRERSGSEDYSYAFIAQYKKDKSLNGLNVAEAARKLRGSDSLRAQIETILEIQNNGSATAVFHGINEDDLTHFMRHTNTMFASDSGVRRFKEGVPHPRGYGNNARILGRYVREQRVLPLEEAIRRMTSLPATTFRMGERGRLEPGYWADVVVFDPVTVKDNATYKEPHQYATGFKRVFVNGEAVVKNDRHTGARPGRTVRRSNGSRQS
jgi:N-acyl-D-amino-acid deacylase